MDACSTPVGNQACMNPLSSGTTTAMEEMMGIAQKCVPLSLRRSRSQKRPKSPHQLTTSSRRVRTRVLRAQVESLMLQLVKLQHHPFNMPISAMDDGRTEEAILAS